ncbi:uncharacterized protein LOC143425413 [Xylocopa sonorina]|uniref:uncharacterized protein LOC143425413 n=1 Tax=Xylocopa sonorina TaxID=1818115 RepID=UPI00403ACCA4
MKSFIVNTFLLAICLLPNIKGDCQYEGGTLTEGKHYINCQVWTCYPNGNIATLGCATYACPEGTQIGYRENDLSKPYPECCGGPVCKGVK